MAKLYFHYSTMNAGKSTVLLQAAHNYSERGMVPYLLTAKLDYRAGKGWIKSRIGIGQKSDVFSKRENLFVKLKNQLNKKIINCVFVDEAQTAAVEDESDSVPPRGSCPIRSLQCPS